MAEWKSPLNFMPSRASGTTCDYQPSKPTAKVPPFKAPLPGKACKLEVPRLSFELPSLKGMKSNYVTQKRPSTNQKRKSETFVTDFEEITIGPPTESLTTNSPSLTPSFVLPCRTGNSKVLKLERSEPFAVASPAPSTSLEVSFQTESDSDDDLITAVEAAEEDCQASQFCPQNLAIGRTFYEHDERSNSSFIGSVVCDQSQRSAEPEELLSENEYVAGRGSNSADSWEANTEALSGSECYNYLKSLQTDNFPMSRKRELWSGSGSDDHVGSCEREAKAKAFTHGRRNGLVEQLEKLPLLTLPVHSFRPAELEQAHADLSEHLGDLNQAICDLIDKISLGALVELLKAEVDQNDLKSLVLLRKRMKAKDKQITNRQCSLQSNSSLEKEESRLSNSHVDFAVPGTSSSFLKRSASVKRPTNESAVAPVATVAKSNRLHERNGKCNFSNPTVMSDYVQQHPARQNARNADKSSFEINQQCNAYGNNASVAEFENCNEFTCQESDDNHDEDEDSHDEDDDMESQDDAEFDPDYNCDRNPFEDDEVFTVDSDDGSLSQSESLIDLREFGINDDESYAPTQATTSNFGSRKAVTKHDVRGKFRGLFRDDGRTNEFTGEFEITPQVYDAFYNMFGLSQWRFNQLQAINAALQGHDTFIIMPTGGGKSLCYQLPAMVQGGVTLVISPLKSLILDQVQKLTALNVPAVSMTADDCNDAEVFSRLMYRDSAYRLVYVTPEKVAQSPNFLNALMQLYRRGALTRFVIDEAHCVSDWGHDFRPDYKRLKELRTQFPNVPMMALTATAAPRARVDILKQLGIANAKWFMQSFNRENLKYSVEPKQGKLLDRIVKKLKEDYKFRQSGIIYCLSRKECEHVSGELQRHGIKAEAYHAGQSDTVRKDVQKQWVQNSIQVICATIAFGMGIDKANVRFVFHYSLPKSVEGYYQETGRAGRDGLPAECILYYSYNDSIRLRKLIQAEKQGDGVVQARHLDNVRQMVVYAESKAQCRRQFLLGYFGEVFDSLHCADGGENSGCDVCQSSANYEPTDATEEVKFLLTQVRGLLVNANGKQNNHTLKTLTDIYRGAQNQKIQQGGFENCPLYGRGCTWLQKTCDHERFMHQLVSEQILEEQLFSTAQDYVVSYIRLGRNADAVLKGSRKVRFYIQQAASNNKKPVVQVVKQELPAVNSSMVIRCRASVEDKLREIAERLKFSSYTSVLSMGAITQLAQTLPRTESDLLKIDTMTTTKMRQFGAEILKVLEPFWLEQDEFEAKEIEAEVGRANGQGLARSPYFAPQSILPLSNGGRGRKRARGQHSGSGSSRGRGRKRNYQPRGKSSGSASQPKGAYKSASQSQRGKGRGSRSGRGDGGTSVKRGRGGGGCGSNVNSGTTVRPGFSQSVKANPNTVRPAGLPSAMFPSLPKPKMSSKFKNERN